MLILILLLLAPLFTYLCSKLAKLTSIPPLIFYIVLGILFGSSGIVNIFAIPQVLHASSIYNTNISLIILFISAGLGINFVIIKKTGLTTLLLSTLPVHIEAFLMALVLYFLMHIFDTGFSLTLLQTLIITILLAMGSAAIVVSNITDHHQRGLKSPNSIGDNMLVSSVLDNFTIMILLVLVLSIVISNASNSSTSILFTVGLSLLNMFLAILFGVLQAYLAYTIIKHINRLYKLNPLFVCIVILILAIVSIYQVKYLASYNVLTALAIGVTFNLALSKTSDRQSAAKYVGLIYKYFAGPIIFISLGAALELDKLFNINLLLVGIISYIVASIIKGAITYFILKRSAYSHNEIKYAVANFSVKGTGAINFSIALASVFAVNNITFISDFMSYIAVIYVLISIPITTIVFTAKTKKWLHHK